MEVDSRIETNDKQHEALVAVIQKINDILGKRRSPKVSKKRLRENGSPVSDSPKFKRLRRNADAEGSK